MATDSETPAVVAKYTKLTLPIPKPPGINDKIDITIAIICDETTGKNDTCSKERTSVNKLRTSINQEKRLSNKSLGKRPFDLIYFIDS